MKSDHIITIQLLIEGLNMTLPRPMDAFTSAAQEVGLKAKDIGEAFAALAEETDTDPLFEAEDFADIDIDIDVEDEDEDEEDDE